MRSIRALALGFILSLGACQSAPKSTQTEESVMIREITYSAGDKKMVGYLALPKDHNGLLPGVLVVHEWWGQTEYPRRRARMLAEMGYAAMAVDMFGDRQIADHPRSAAEFARSAMANSRTVAERFQAAREAMVATGFVNQDKIAAVGYCFGGSVVLEMARQGAPLKGVASFHGGLITPSKAKKGQVKAEVLVLNGADDPMVTEDNIRSFNQEMKNAGVKFELISYAGATHAFTNPEATENGKKFSLPLAYHPEADAESWQKLRTFLQRLL